MGSNKKHKEIICGIYCIENLINGKMYIGQAQDIFHRWIEHNCDLRKNKDSRVLQRAWNKYGKDNFEFWIICKCRIEELNDLEMFFIEEWHTLVTEHGYNIYIGGNVGNRGTTLSEETKLKISKSLIGRVFSEETKDRLSKSKMGRKRVENSSSKYVGVTRLPYGWRSRIQNDGIYKDIGCFLTEIDAGLAYNKKAIELYGENATINEISEEEIKQNLIDKIKINNEKVKNQKSIYRGVYKPKDYNKWVTRILINGVRVKLGTFENEIDAALAYNKAAIQYHGKKAKLNII